MADQYSTITNLGDKAYPPLSIRGVGIVRGKQETIGATILAPKYVFLESYSEQYQQHWTFEEIPHEINKKAKHGGVDRFINITFKLGARNVHEAKKNLDFCTKLARSTLPIVLADGGMADQRAYIINFGTLLREQLVDVLSYNFKMNFEDGVFDYGSTTLKTPDPAAPRSAIYVRQPVGKAMDSTWNNQGGYQGASNGLLEHDYVYHGQAGGVLAKSVTISLQLQAYRNEDGNEPGELGFGGRFRQDGSQGWALRPHRSLDWPHGTGPIAAAAYCQRDPVFADASEAVVDRGDTEGVRDRTD